MSTSNAKGVPLDGEYLKFPSDEVLLKLFATSSLKAAHGLAYASFLGLGRKGDHYRHLVIAMTKEMAPRGVYEGMLVTQMITAHIAFANATGKMLDAQDDQSREQYSRIASRASQTTSALNDKLRIYRSGGQANINISQVTVQNGGKAIVGSVSAEVPRNDK